MGEDKNKCTKLESEASQLIDEAALDEQQLDKAAELLAEAEKLKGPLVKEPVKQPSPIKDSTTKNEPADKKEAPGQGLSPESQRLSEA